jgi:hypothetical protein
MTSLSAQVTALTGASPPYKAPHRQMKSHHRTVNFTSLQFSLIVSACKFRRAQVLLYPNPVLEKSHILNTQQNRLISVLTLWRPPFEVDTF